MSLNTIKKIGPVLDLFTPERPEWRMTEIARVLEMPKSSAHTLVTTLAEIGLLTTTNRGGYRLGWNILDLGERMRASLDFRRHALPAMHELSESVQETVLLAALDRRRVIYLERAEGRHPMVRLAGVRPGATAPAHCTSVGKVLLAYRDPAEVRALFARECPKAMTRRTITDVDQLLSELAKVRSRGFAYDIGEIVPDVCAVGAPVFDRFDSVVAAMSVAMPAYRFEAKRAAVSKGIQAAAAAASASLAAAQVAMANDPAPPLEIAVVA